MSRTPIAFEAPDISALARSVRDQLQALGHTPTHLQLLNMLARAAGHQNFQALRAGAPSTPKSAPDAAEAEPLDDRRIRRAVGYFDAQWRMVSWPAKTNLQGLCLWVLWALLPARQVFTEREISDLIDTRHLFGDRALLRRELVDRGLVQRTQNGSEYRRVEQKPPPELAAMLKRLGGETARSPQKK